MHHELEGWLKCCAANFPFLSVFLLVLICSAALSEACNIMTSLRKFCAPASHARATSKCNKPGYEVGTFTVYEVSPCHQLIRTSKAALMPSCWNGTTQPYRLYIVRFFSSRKSSVTTKFNRL